MRHKLYLKKWGVTYYTERWKYPKDFSGPSCWWGTTVAAAGLQKGIWKNPFSKEFWKNSYVLLILHCGKWIFIWIYCLVHQKFNSYKYLFQLLQLVIHRCLFHALWSAPGMHLNKRALQSSTYPRACIYISVWAAINKA